MPKKYINVNLIQHMKIIFFSEFSRKIGSGHYIRSQRLYNELKNKHETQYFLNKNKVFINNFLKKNKKKCIYIFDLKKYEKFHNSKKNFYIYFDNKIYMGKNSININPLFPDHKNYNGPKWHVFPKDFDIKKVFRKITKKRKILICQGGTDPHNNIPKLIRIVKNKIKDLEFELHVLINNKLLISNKLKKKYLLHEHKNIKKMSKFLKEYDHIITGCGNICLEINYLGIPSTYVSSEKREIKLAKYFKKKGFGNFFKVTDAKKIREHLHKQLKISKDGKINIMKKKIKYFRHDGLKNINKLIDKLKYEI